MRSRQAGFGLKINQMRKHHILYRQNPSNACCDSTHQTSSQEAKKVAKILRRGDRGKRECNTLHDFNRKRALMRILTLNMSVTWRSTSGDSALDRIVMIDAAQTYTMVELNLVSRKVQWPMQLIHNAKRGF